MTFASAVTITALSRGLTMFTKTEVCLCQATDVDVLLIHIVVEDLPRPLALDMHYHPPHPHWYHPLWVVQNS